MGNFSNPPIGLELDEVKEMTNKIGLELASHDIRRPEDIASDGGAVKANDCRTLRTSWFSGR